MSAVLVTHTHPETSAEGVAAAIAAAKEPGVELVAPTDEHQKHGEAAEGMGRVEELPGKPDVCIVLGGDGSILYALRHYADSGVPVFGINFGTIGFLAAVERERPRRRPAAGAGGRLRGDGDARPGPCDAGRHPVALNDVSFTRKPHGRVAELSYRVAREEVATSAATAWSPRPRRGPPATTSPTRARSWRGGWRATSSASSPRTP